MGCEEVVMIRYRKIDDYKSKPNVYCGIFNTNYWYIEENG